MQKSLRLQLTPASIKNHKNKWYFKICHCLNTFSAVEKTPLYFPNNREFSSLLRCILQKVIQLCHSKHEVEQTTWNS